MEITAITYGDTVILRPDASIDSRSATHLERKIVELLDGGSHQLVIDFSVVDHLTSEGIRILLMAAKRLDAVDGGMALCSLNEHVKTIFEVSGLTSYFRIAPSREEAIAQLDPGPAAPKPSRLLSMALKLLGGGSRSHKQETSQSKGKGHAKLSSKVAELLTGRGSSATSESSPRKNTRKHGSSPGDSARGKTSS